MKTVYLVMARITEPTHDFVGAEWVVAAYTTRNAAQKRADLCNGVAQKFHDAFKRYCQACRGSNPDKDVVRKAGKLLAQEEAAINASEHDPRGTHKDVGYHVAEIPLETRYPV